MRVKNGEKLVVTRKDIGYCGGQIFTLEEICAEMAKDFEWRDDYTVYKNGFVKFKERGVLYRGKMEGTAFVYNEMDEVDGTVYDEEEIIDWLDVVGGSAAIPAKLNGETVYIVIP